jgi:hypothetical protein
MSVGEPPYSCPDSGTTGGGGEGDGEGGAARASRSSKEACRHHLQRGEAADESLLGATDLAVSALALVECTLF